MIELEHTRDLLEGLGLTTAAELLDARLEAAAHSELTYLSFLAGLLEVEKTERQRRSEETRIKLSRLPHQKTLEEFDFDFQPNIDRRQFKELSTLSFAARSENVILLGPPGVGKTHLAIGLAVQALRSGMTVYFASLTQLIADLKKAIDDCTPGDCRNILKTVENIRFTEDDAILLKNLLNAVNNFDFEQAEKFRQELERKLQG